MGPTAQEVFDTVCRHLLTQNARSTNASGSCQYRGVEGRKCAVGCLIPDEMYSARMEGGTVFSTHVSSVLAELRQHAHQLMLSELQHIHDEYEPCSWRRELLVVAKERGLSTAVLDEVARG